MSKRTAMLVFGLFQLYALSLAVEATEQTQLLLPPSPCATKIIAVVESNPLALLKKNLTPKAHQHLQSIILNFMHTSRYENWLEKRKANGKGPELFTSALNDEFSAFFRSDSFTDFRGNVWALRIPTKKMSVWNGLSEIERVHLVDKLAHILHPAPHHRHPIKAVHLDALVPEQVYSGRQFLFAGFHNYIPHFIGKEAIDLSPFALASILLELGAPEESMSFKIGQLFEQGGAKLSWLEIQISDSHPPLRVSLQILDQFGLRDMSAPIGDPRSSLSNTYFKNVIRTEILTIRYGT